MKQFKRYEDAVFHKGKVKLITSRHGISLANPFVGSKFECEGVVYEKKGGSDSLNLRVRWDNGEINSYHHTDLAKVTQIHTEIKLDNLYEQV